MRPAAESAERGKLFRRKEWPGREDQTRRGSEKWPRSPGGDGAKVARCRSQKAKEIVGAAHTAIMGVTAKAGNVVFCLTCSLAMSVLTLAWQQGLGLTRLQWAFLQQSWACSLLMSMLRQSPPCRRKMAADNTTATMRPPIMLIVYIAFRSAHSAPNWPLNMCGVRHAFGWADLRFPEN